jgi:hypothetical protein
MKEVLKSLYFVIFFYIFLFKFKNRNFVLFRFRHIWLKQLVIATYRCMADFCSVMCTHIATYYIFPPTINHQLRFQKCNFHLKKNIFTFSNATIENIVKFTTCNNHADCCFFLSPTFLHFNLLACTSFYLHYRFIVQSLTTILQLLYVPSKHVKSQSNLTWRCGWNFSRYIWYFIDGLSITANRNEHNSIRNLHVVLALKLL